MYIALYSKVDTVTTHVQMCRVVCRHVLLPSPAVRSLYLNVVHLPRAVGRRQDETLPAEAQQVSLLDVQRETLADKVGVAVEAPLPDARVVATLLHQEARQQLVLKPAVSHQSVTSVTIVLLHLIIGPTLYRHRVWSRSKPIQS